jgi:translation initiation factor IF-2
MENFLGKTVPSATFSSPIRLVGWNKIPPTGAEFKSFQKKSDAEEFAASPENKKSDAKVSASNSTSDKKIIPIILKADVWGSIEAIEKEIGKIKNENAEFKIIAKGVGSITETDLKSVSSGADAIVIGFNVKADKSTAEYAIKRDITISFFDIIYKMSEWLEEEMEKRRPRVETVTTTGRAKIIKAFSRTKERQIIGGKVVEGSISLGSVVKIIRREFEIGQGKIVNLEKSKEKTSTVDEGSEFGMMLESKIEVVGGDVIEAFAITQQ